MADLKEAIKQLAAQYAADTISIRRHLHANPEHSFQEYNTSAFVKQRLQEYGLKPVSMAETGVVVLVEGKHPEKRTIALRADMDALPIDEQNEVPYKSKNAGV